MLRRLHLVTVAFLLLSGLLVLFSSGRSGELKDSCWRQRAACRDAGPAVFFPAGNSQLRQAEERAKKLCSSCPVQAPCLALAIEQDESYGIWGGLNPDERRTLKTALPKTGDGAK